MQAENSTEARGTATGDMGTAAARKGVTDFFAREAKRLGYVARSALKLSEMHAKFGVLDVRGAGRRASARVLDLGCHPGAWLQVACRHLKPDAAVLGVDLSETDASALRFVDRRVRTARRDVFHLDELAVRRMMSESGWGSALDTESATDHPGGGGGGRGVFTTILSDMAPSTTGNRTTDAARSYDLAEHAVRLALGDAALDILDSSSDRDAEDADSRVALDSAAADATSAGLLRAGGSLVVKLLEGPGGGREDLQAACKPNFDSVRWFRPKATRRESTEVFLVARGRRAAPKRTSPRVV